MLKTQEPRGRPVSSTGRRIIRMPLSALLSVLAQPELGADAPSWAPIVFAVGALVVVVLVLILVRQSSNSMRCADRTQTTQKTLMHVTQTKTEARVWAAPLPLTALALCAGLITLTIAGLLTGLAQAGEISDPGAVTRWGLPTARYVHHLAAATAISSAILAAIAVPPRTGPRQRRKADRSADQHSEHPIYARLLQIATIAAIVWVVAALAVMVLTFSTLAGLPFSADESFSTGFFDFVTNITTGQAWLTVVLIAGAFGTLVAAVRSPAGLGFTAVLGLCALVPIAMVGHSSSGDDHNAAVSSLGLHLLGVVIWVGGLVTLALLAPQIARTASQSECPGPGRARAAGHPAASLLAAGRSGTGHCCRLRGDQRRSARELIRPAVHHRLRTHAGRQDHRHRGARRGRMDASQLGHPPPGRIPPGHFNAARNAARRNSSTQLFTLHHHQTAVADDPGRGRHHVLGDRRQRGAGPHGTAGSR